MILLVGRSIRSCALVLLRLRTTALTTLRIAARAIGRRHCGDIGRIGGHATLILTEAVVVMAMAVAPIAELALLTPFATLALATTLTALATIAVLAATLASLVGTALAALLSTLMAGHRRLRHAAPAHSRLTVLVLAPLPLLLAC